MRRLTQVAMLLTILAGAFMVAAPRPAFAHGEIAQEAFIKTQTVTFYDVKFSKAEIQRNEKMTISGRFRVLNAWPAHNSVLPENTEAYISAVALTLANPPTILSFAAIFAGLGVGTTGRASGAAVVLVLGVLVGSALWWVLLSSGVAIVRARVTPRVLRWINRLSGTLLVAFGVVALGSVR